MPSQNELLFGTIAIEFGLLRPEQLAECVRLQTGPQVIIPPPLGELLVRRGYLQAGDLPRILREQANRVKVYSAPTPREVRGEPFGQLLVQQGFINRYQLNECLRLQAWLKEEFALFYRLGELIVRKRYMTREQVRLALAKQVKGLRHCPKCLKRTRRTKGAKGSPPCDRCGGALQAVAADLDPEEGLLASLFRSLLPAEKLPEMPPEEEVQELEPDRVPAAPIARSAQEHSMDEEQSPAPAGDPLVATDAEFDCAREDRSRRLDRFVLVHRLRTGPRGETWLGVREDTRARALVKVLSRGALTGEAGRQWVEICRKVASKQPPAALRVLGVGQAEGRAFVAHEPVPLVGVEELATRGRIGPGQVWALAESLLVALVSFHARGIVHGNLKATNLMIPCAAGLYEDARLDAAATTLEGMKLADFGLPPLPGTGAPELESGGAASVSADLWATGEMLRALLPPEERGRGAVLARALDPDPAKRFRGAAEMLQAVKLCRPAAVCQPDRHDEMELGAI